MLVDSELARDRTLGVFCYGVGSLLQFRRTKIGLVGLWPTDTQRLADHWPKEESSPSCHILLLFSLSNLASVALTSGGAEA
jgi:hypothetical protein